MISGKRFKQARIAARLTLFDCAYLCNTHPRTIRRWEIEKPGYEPKPDATKLVALFADGLVPHSWIDWRAHGVNPDTWRPKSLAGHTPTNAGILLRKKHGADALA